MWVPGSHPQSVWVSRSGGIWEGSEQPQVSWALQVSVTISQLADAERKASGIAQSFHVLLWAYGKGNSRVRSDLAPTLCLNSFFWRWHCGSAGTPQGSKGKKLRWQGTWRSVEKRQGWQRAHLASWLSFDHWESLGSSLFAGDPNRLGTIDLNGERNLPRSNCPNHQRPWDNPSRPPAGLLWCWGSAAHRFKSSPGRSRNV